MQCYKICLWPVLGTHLMPKEYLMTVSVYCSTTNVETEIFFFITIKILRHHKLITFLSVDMEILTPRGSQVHREAPDRK